uniref:Cytochrome c oxidase subunit 3 n=1 Tax=Coeloplana loyai TaxID=1742921 RepID=A0A2R4ZJ57_9METZ|nr:cytochrome c oxidase subunit III [Coeloplana loyai]
MLTHIAPSFYPFYISIFLSLFFLFLVYSIYFKSSIVFLFFSLFFLFSLVFFFLFYKEVKDFSILQFFFNSQYFYFFVFSEFCFFFGVFWTVFWGIYSFDYFNSNYLTYNQGINLIYPYGLPLLNTLLLLTSACFATIYHELFFCYKEDYSLIICFIFGVLFILIQFYEFNSASFTIGYSNFGSSFFLSTGFHGFHVLLGLFFILIFIFISKFYFFYYVLNYLNVSLIYWHFVDVIWLFLFVFVYTIVYLSYY